MLLRLTTTEIGDQVVVRIAGRLAKEGLEALERACRRVTGALVLDLGDLIGVDDCGVAALRRLSSEGARLVNASPYVALLLAGPHSDPAPTGGEQASAGPVHWAQRPREQQ